MAWPSRRRRIRSRGWDALPKSYAIPEIAPELYDAQLYCERLARSHYENFSVATWFLPKHLRQHFFNIYAYCRISDDLGDEVGDPAQSLVLLDEWQAELDRCYAGTSRHPVFVALRETVRALATRELSAANAGRVIFREVLVGLVNGLAFAAITGVAAAAWFKVADLGLVIGLAMLCNLLAAALGGTLVPLVLYHFRADPAVSSGVFVTTVTDVVGFFSFLGIATLWFGLK